MGLADGRVLPFSIDNAAAQRKLALYDVVLVRVTDGKGKTAARAELRVRPVVQGAVVVLENKTGRILAMSGGFSYPLSQLNRMSQAMRQPGSAIKPLSYLAALRRGLQPNTLVSDEPITLPPIGRGRAREQDYWTPKNYDGGGGRHSDLAPRAGEFAQSRHRPSARRRHRKHPGGEPRSRLQARGGSADLPRMRAILSVRARCPAGAADRSRGVLCHDRE